MLRQRDTTYDPFYYPLTRQMFRRYGLYPHPSDDHIGEYLSFAWEVCGLHGYDFQAADRRRAESLCHLRSVAQGEAAVRLPGDPAGTGQTDALQTSGEFAFSIISAVLSNTRQIIGAVNIPNNGLIPNLPAWSVVEVPAVAGADGIRGVQIGSLPAGIAALLSVQLHVQDLVVEAAVHGSRDLALQALLADPVVQSAEAAEKTLDELLSVHAAYLPQFTTQVR